MRYVVFGAGKWGKLAMDFLGIPRVECFIDNYKAGTEYYGKDVVDLDALLGMDLEETVVVLAAENGWVEMEERLKEHSIRKYFRFMEGHLGLWTQTLPHYYLNKQFELVSYNRLLAAYDLSGYKRIAILGANELTPYLISEIAFQHRIDSICEVIKFDDKEYQTIGVPCSKWDSADKDFDCLIVNERRHLIKNLEIYENAAENGKADIIDIYDADIVEPTFFYHPELKKYKDMYKGKRIFVIGNGPSLTIEDLNILHQHQEICIASNNFYRVYDQTDFRADFHLMSDQDIIEENGEKLKSIPGNVLIGDGYHVERPDRKIEGVQYFHMFSFSGFLPNYPKFSEELSKGLYRGGTVTYGSLQLAAYLGAREIYLLGVDHSYSNDVSAEENHFIKNYLTEEEMKKFTERYKTVTYNVDNANKAFEAAEIYSRKHGFRIYNATRGGKLEVFERVDFDSLFEKSADSSNG